MNKMLSMARIMFLPIMLFLAACGGGEGGGGTGSSTVSGVAAAGAPLVGSVTIKDSSTPAKTKNIVIAGDGSFSIDISGLTPPFILMATGNVGSTAYTLHSFAQGAGTANINPFANLVVVLASGGLDPATIYASPSAAITQTITSKLPVTITDIQTKLGALLALYDSTKIDPVTCNFIANHTGLDEVLDMVSIDVFSGIITIRNKTTNAVVFTAPVNNFASGTLDASKLPTPQIRAVISPIFASVPLSKSFNFTADVLRSTNKSVTWSVVESGGGTITSAGVYTAPSVEGTFHVKATSVANPTLPAIAIVKVIPYNVIVDVTPPSTTMASGSSKTFSATVTGSSNTSVTWSVVEAGGGSVTSSGVYTAPSLAGTYHVKATSVADPAKSDTAAITVTPAGITINPVTASMSTGVEMTFEATVTGTSNAAVHWNVVESGGGYIASVGGPSIGGVSACVYQAPFTAGIYHLKATSVADPTKSATTTVTVSVPKPFPIGTWVGPHNITITVNALFDTMGDYNLYTGSVSYPAFSGGIVTVSGSLFDAGGTINYVQKNVLAVTVQSVSGSSVSSFAFAGDGTIDYNMKPPITTLPGQLVIVSSIPGYSYTERATFHKQ